MAAGADRRPRALRTSSSCCSTTSATRSSAATAPTSPRRASTGWPRDGPPLLELPHHRAVLADACVPAHRSQPPQQRHGAHRRVRRRASPATTPRSRTRTASSRRSSCATATPPSRSASGTSRPASEMTMGSPRDKWPLGRGFERFYGFMGGETDQYHPELVYDNHFVEPPRTPEEGYHLTEDLADQAILFMKDLRATAPDKPFFLWFTPGACHAPAPGADGVHRAVPRPVRPGLGRVARAGVRAPGRVGAAAGGHAPVRAPVVGAGVGLAHRRRAAPLRPDDGGVRRLPHPHRRAGAARARLHRRARRARQHDRARDERQRRQRRGRRQGAASTSSTSSTSCPRAPRRTSGASTTSARPAPTTTTPGGGRGPATRRSSGSSATPTRAAWPTRSSSTGRSGSATGGTRHQYVHAIDVHADPARAHRHRAARR